MELFYCPELTDQSTQVNLSEQESHHIRRVFRKKKGDNLQLTNGKGILANAVITDEVSRKLPCIIQESRIIAPPLERNIHLAISTIRPNRMDWAVEKLTELGIGAIQPIFSQFTSIKTFKHHHLQRIMISAMKQSRQAFLPELNSPVNFRDYLEQLPSTFSFRWIAHLTPEAQSFKHIKLLSNSLVLVIVGPEGGFSEQEIALARQFNVQPLRLSNQVLRSETAAITSIAQLKLKIC